LLAIASAAVLAVSCDGKRTEATTGKAAAGPAAPAELGVHPVDRPLLRSERDFRPRFVAVMIDDTGSFVDYWDRAIACAARVTAKLEGGDTVCVIAMDEAYSPDTRTVESEGRVVKLPGDLLVGPIILRRDLTYRRQKTALVEQVCGLQCRAKLSGSKGSPLWQPMVGACREMKRRADDEAKAETPAAERSEFVMVILSDMRPDAEWPSSAPTRFPEGARAFCYLVYTPDPEECAGEEPMAVWDRVVGRWVDLFTSMGVQVAKGDFYTVTQTDPDGSVFKRD
jgi:hypothetical protein